MKWYDIVAPIYDRTINKPYLPYRQLAVQTLHLQPGQTIIDIGCGTGLNFELIQNEIDGEGTLIGIDSSAKMINRAHQKIELNKWINIYLLQKEARKITLNELETLTGKRLKVDRVLCTLGFSVFPDWQSVFEQTFHLLESGGRYCIMDIFNDKITFRTRIVSILANANNSRQVWEPLKKISANYSEERYPMIHNDIVVIASGTKL
jgi:S-adenosylmethionine-diacylgycerolhomoserine-N-methlytransferase